MLAFNEVENTFAKTIPNLSLDELLNRKRIALVSSAEYNAKAAVHQQEFDDEIDLSTSRYTEPTSGQLSSLEKVNACELECDLYKMHARVYNILAIIKVIDGIKTASKRTIVYEAVTTDLSTCELLQNALEAIRSADDARRGSAYYLAEYEEMCTQLRADGHEPRYILEDGTVKFSSSWDFMTEPIIGNQYECYFCYENMMQVAHAYNQLARIKMDHENYFVSNLVEIPNKVSADYSSGEDMFLLCEIAINDARSSFLDERRYTDQYHENVHKVVREDVDSCEAHEILLESLAYDAVVAEKKAEHLLELAYAYNEHLVSNMEECV